MKKDRSWIEEVSGSVSASQRERELNRVLLGALLGVTGS